jgi:hypothetical protein
MTDHMMDQEHKRLASVFPLVRVPVFQVGTGGSWADPEPKSSSVSGSMSSSSVSNASSVSSASSMEATHRAIVLNSMQVSIKAEAVCDADVPPVEEKMPSPATAKSVISAMRQSLDAARADLKEALSRVRELEEEAAKKRKRDAEKMQQEQEQEQQEQEAAKKRKREQEEAAEEEIIVRGYQTYLFRPLLCQTNVSSIVAAAAAVRMTDDVRFDSITKKLRDDIVLDLIRVVAREKKPAAAVTKP